MAGRSRTLSVEIVGDAKGLSGAFNDAEKSVDGFGKKIGGAAKVAGLAIGGIAVAGIGAAAILGPKILEMGASMEALAVKSKTVFEGSIDEVEDWAAANAASMGFTEDALVGAAAGFADLLKPMGFTAEQAADMSTEALDLAGALSAWSGGTVDAAAASDILAKAMLGETDGLKGLGIAISAADIQQRLLEKGQQDLTGAALQQAQALATQELIMEKSTDAQKAWNDGSMDGIKAQNEMKASMSTLTESLVTALYPAFQAIVPVVTEVAEWLSVNLPKAMEVVKEWVTENWPVIREHILEAVAKIREGIDGFIVFVTDAWKKWGDEILAVINIVWPYIRSTIENVITIVRGIIKTVTDLIRGDWEGVWNGILQIVSGLWEQIKNVVSTAANLMKLALGLIWDGIKTMTSAAWSGIKEAIREQIDAVVGFVTGLPAKFAAVFPYLWTGLMSGITVAKDWVGDKIDEVVEFAKKLPARMSGLFSGMWDGIKNAFKSALNWVIDKWNGLDFTLPKVSFLGQTVGGGTIGMPHIPRLHTGGIAGGMSFAGMADDEVAAILRKGERILTPGQTAALGNTDGGARVYNLAITVPPTADMASIGRVTVEAIREFEQINGASWRGAVA